MIAAFAPAKVPPQAGNAAFDARTPAIAPFPRAGVFQGLAFLRQLARGWDGYPLDPGGFELLLRVRRMYASIARHQIGGMLKERAMMGHCLDRLSMLVGVLQNLVAGDNAALDFIQDHLPTKLDQRTTFMAGYGAGMGL